MTMETSYLLGVQPLRNLSNPASISILGFIHSCWVPTNGSRCDFIPDHQDGISSHTVVVWEFLLSIWVCLKMSCTPKPNGFADHYPY